MESSTDSQDPTTLEYNDFERELQTWFLSEYDARRFTFSVNQGHLHLAEVKIIRLGSRTDTPNMSFNLMDCNALERAKAAIRKKYITKQG